MNGRVGKTDAWTSASSNGMSVADYAFVLHHKLYHVDSFSIHSPIEMFSQIDQYQTITYFVWICSTMKALHIVHNHVLFKKHIKTPLPNNFLARQDIQQLSDQKIVKLEHECENRIT